MHNCRLALTKIVISLFVLLFLVSVTSQLYASNANGRVFQWEEDLSVSEVEGMGGIISVSKGLFHSLALRDDGTVWAWGKNQYGQLGIGNKVDSLTPQQVKGPNGQGFLTDIQKIAAGERFSMALLKDGTVFVWGENGSGVRGTAISGINAPDLLYPTPVKKSSTLNLSNIVEIEGGDDFSLALDSTGLVFSWGWNGNGELGIGCFPTSGQCSRDFIPNSPVPNLTDIIDVAAGGHHILVLKSDGTVWGWGRAQEGQLGAATNLSRIASPIQIPGLSGITKISAENYGSAALTEVGEVYIWGKGIHNPFKIPNLSNINEISVGSNDDLAVKDDGSVWRWNSNDVQPQTIPNLTKITVIAAGYGNPSLAVEKYDPTPPAPEPFLNLPVNYVALGKTFDEIALDPESWFDHQYPLQNVLCCTTKVLNYTGREIDGYYRSHAGYDYASRQGLGHEKSVLAAAAGEATFYPLHGALGNLIKIDHENGYQTWYAHLDSSTLDFDNSETVEVLAGQEIGKVGKTGNVTGPHLHFAVFKDENDDGDFSNDYPVGLVDPLGWLGSTTDPWEEYEINGKKGSKSYNLFIDHNFQKDESIPDTGGVVNYQNLTISIPSGAANSSLTIKIKKGPFEKKSSTEKSIAPSFFIEAYNALNQNVKDFNEPVTLSYDYSNSDLSNIDEETLKFYYFDDENNTWVELPSTIYPNKTVVTITPHFSQFAVMGDLIDTTPPATIVDTEGYEGQENWFRSDVKISLESTDNVGGLGVFDTIYSLDGQEWDIYTSPLEFYNEGEHNISYMSYDNTGNEEEIKTYTFNIDKTSPVTTLKTDVTYIWPPDGRIVPVKVDGTVQEDNLFLKTLVVTDEYNEIQPQNIDFGQTVNLKASRKGDDKDGRQYMVKLTVIDLAGNITEKEETITVLHDQAINF